MSSEEHIKVGFVPLISAIHMSCDTFRPMAHLLSVLTRLTTDGRELEDETAREQAFHLLSPAARFVAYL